MKKIYQAPIVSVNFVQTTHMLALSLDKNDVGSDGSVLVKGDRGADRGSRSERSDYNVWKDDWSNN